MTITQLSIFVENRTGRINDVVRILAAEGINLHAFSLADAADFGILRMIVSDSQRALEVLRAAHFGVKLTDVLCLHCGNTPGALSEILDVLARENIFIEYMYAFSEGEVARIVIRPTDLHKCIEILSRDKCELLSAQTLNR